LRTAISDLKSDSWLADLVYNYGTLKLISEKQELRLLIAVILLSDLVILFVGNYNSIGNSNCFLSLNSGLQVLKARYESINYYSDSLLEIS